MRNVDGDVWDKEEGRWRERRRVKKNPEIICPYMDAKLPKKAS